MAVIFETENFLVQSAEPPLVDRNDGGHIIIDPKFKVSARQELSPQQAIELMRLTIVAGEAMAYVMNQHGVDIGRINYQDNGNWSVLTPKGPQLHYHLYGRAKSATQQKYGQTLYLPHRDDHPEYYAQLQKLTAADEASIKARMTEQFKRSKFSDESWGLKRIDG